MLEVGISRLHPEPINRRGRLKYRLSYGQNVLNHLVETAKVAGMLASEVGVDAAQARRAAFLHDIRKAGSHERGESYVHRLERIEEIAGAFPGVERVYAMQAGREVRVVVDPGTIDDLGAGDLARRISRRLEEDLQYPGQIQVTVIRELAAGGYARRACRWPC